MFTRKIALILFSFLILNFPTHESLAKRRKRKSQSTKKIAKKRKKRGRNKKRLQKKETVNQKVSEEEKFRKLKQNMTASQFKEMWTAWNRSQMLGSSSKSKFSNQNLNKLTTEIQQLEQKYKTEQDEINAIKKRIAILKKDLEVLSKKKPRKRRDKKKIKKRIEEIKKEINKLLKQLEHSVKASKLTEDRLQGLKENFEIAKKSANKVSEAELVMMESIDTKGLNDEQKNMIVSLRKKIQEVINSYEQTGSLEKNQYKDLVNLIQELTSLLRKYCNNGGRIVDFNERIETLNSLVKDLEGEYTTKGFLKKPKLANTIAILKEDMKIWSSIDNNKVKQVIHKGLVFKVQLATFRKRNLNKIGKPEEDDLLEQEDNGGLHQYTLRTFRNYWKANEFKKQMRAIMGFDRRETKKEKLKGAPFIVAYRDGKRIPIKEVLDIIKAQKSLK